MKPYPELTGIKSWAEEDRPREKLQLKGKQALSETELIAILLRTGSRKSTAVDIARELLRRSNNDLNELSRWSVKDLLDLDIDGLGKTKSITLVAAMELGRRRQSSEVKEKTKIGSSRDAFEVLHPMLADAAIEQFYALLLNRANKVIEKIKISEGGLTGTVADIRQIFNHAIKSNATGIIVSHNHPSGNLTPSQNDIDLTHKLRDAGKVLDISLLDHLIITTAGYYSFSDEGML